MDRQADTDTGRVLRVLADLAPGADAVDLDVRRAGAFDWLGVRAWPAGVERGEASERVPLPGPGGEGRRRLAELDALHAGEDLLRVGWCFVEGLVEVGGEARRCAFPLATRPIRIAGGPLGTTIQFLGPWDLTPLVRDPAVAGDLEVRIEFGGGALTPTGFAAAPTASTALLDRLPRLQSWVAEVLAAAGLPALPIRIDDDRGPMPDAPAPAVAIGFGLHLGRDVESGDLRTGLANWAGTPGLSATALPAAYGLAPPTGPPAAGSDEPVVSALELSAAQADVVRRSRTEPVVVVSGPPGTGKSHLAAALALDAVRRGESVLLAARTTQAADVLAGLLEERPGPDPVLFGGGERARRLAARLADGLAAPDPAAGPTLAAAEAGHRGAVAVVDAALAGVAADAWWRRVAPLVPAHREWAPGLFGAGADLTAAGRLAARAGSAGGPLGGWRRRRALRALRRRAGVPGTAGLDALRASLEVARAVAAAAAAPPGVGAEPWAALDAADAAWREALGPALAADLARGVGEADRRAVAALGAALRTGRQQRRRHLRSVDAGALVRALPLWVGTLGDVEDLLPAVPAMFDLVVLDEASQIDQVAAAPALLRGRRVVVAGDPRQLRFVSFTADDAVAAARARHGAEHLADRLDLRRLSAFDLAAGIAPVTTLDEHHRSLPHIIGFSADRFYDGRLAIATRHPSTEARRCIEVRPVPGDRDDAGVNAAEVEAVAAVVDEVLAEPGRTLGLVTPFRAQADALEAMVLARTGLDRIRAARLRVGTVHAFQGDERDVMVLSLALDGGGQAQRFLEDPHLFNVLVTRARRRMVVVTGQVDPDPGLLADYLAWAATAPAPHPGGPAGEGWAAALADALRAAGTPVRTAYPVGVEHVDLVVGPPERAVAVEAGVHPDGYAAHRRRHLALRRSGWRVEDAFPVRFDGDPVAGAVHLTGLVSPPGVNPDLPGRELHP